MSAVHLSPHVECLDQRREERFMEAFSISTVGFQPALPMLTFDSGNNAVIRKRSCMFFGEIFGPDLLVVVVVVAVLLFGGAAIPKLAKNLGSAKSEFEKGLKDSKSHTTLPDSRVVEVRSSDPKFDERDF